MSRCATCDRDLEERPQGGWMCVPCDEFTRARDEFLYNGLGMEHRHVNDAAKIEEAMKAKGAKP